MAVMIGEAIFASSNNVMLMLRESGALNNTALDGDTIQLDTFLNTKNGTCGYEMKTLTNRSWARSTKSATTRQMLLRMMFVSK
ncbi:hypothetical protein GQ600_11146 [Phytophthora cactorum]|nr:hypothetical protein GQ600_11146 [Phytophthora cactorum]